MKTIYILTTAVVILSTVMWVVKYGGNRNSQLINLGFQKVTSSPTPASTPKYPKTFKFDRTTDLKMELEKVNPQVLDSDFEQ